MTGSVNSKRRLVSIHHGVNYSTMSSDYRLPELSEDQTLEVFLEYEISGLKSAVDLMNKYRREPIGIANGMRMIKEKYVAYIKK